MCLYEAMIAATEKNVTQKQSLQDFLLVVEYLFLKLHELY